MKTHFTRKDAVDVTHPRAATPNTPIRSAEHPFDVWHMGARFGGEDLPLGVMAGGTQIGVNITVIPPGMQSCPFHFHMKEEEHFYLLEGRCILRSGADRHEMGPGDYVCFPAGTRVAHAFENPFDAPCRVLCIGNKLDDEVAVYPDSRKMKIRSLALMVPYAEGSLDYWLDERIETAIGEK